MPKNYTRITLSTTGGMQNTAVYLWAPEQPPRGIVQIVHGMREHMGRYVDFAAFLRAQGYAVIGHDHRGHGRSGTGDTAFGFFGESDGPKTLVKDCYRVAKIAQKQFPDTPVFLLGHSMGSLIGRLYILHYDQAIAGFICMGTSGEQRRAPVVRALAEIAIQLRGHKADGRLLHHLSFAAYGRHIENEPSTMSWLSRDRAVVEQFEWDALIRPYFTNAGFRDICDIQIAVSSRKWAEQVNKQLPILLVSGSEDPVGGYGRGVVQVYERLKMAGVLDVECKLYEGARHEILHELNREEVYYDLFSWMEEHRG